MAEVDFDEFEDAVYAPVRDAHRSQVFGQVLNYAGAISSVALVVMLALWGYKLAMRDVNGIPVMKALEGPMRVAPADPGGQTATNQGLSVNAVASTGVASPVADELTLAPGATALTEDDVAGLAAPVAGGAAAPLKPGEVVPAPETVAAIVTDGSEVVMVEETAAPLAEQGSVDAAVAAALADPMTDADTGNGLARSLVPHPRPGAVVAEAEADGALPVAAPVAIDPAAIPVGTRLAQLGAFDTPDEARAKWDGLAVSFAEVMDGKQMVIQQAISGGKTFYRLRAYGFETDDDTRRFCAVFAAANADCTPVVQR